MVRSTPRALRLWRCVTESVHELILANTVSSDFGDEFTATSFGTNTLKDEDDADIQANESFSTT